MYEPVARYSKRTVRTSTAPREEPGWWTLANLNSERPQWLVDARAELDAAVEAAYGWETDTADDQALRKLLELNLRCQTQE